MPSSGSKADEEEEALLDEEEELLDDEELEDELLVEELEEVEAAELVELFVFDGAGAEPPPPPEPQPATSVKNAMATRFLTAVRFLATKVLATELVKPFITSLNYIIYHG